MARPTRGGEAPSSRRQGDPAPETDEISGTRADYAPQGADPKPTTGGTLKRTLKEFSEDNLTDWAAALTYYGVLAIFPAIVALLSIIGLATAVWSASGYVGAFTRAANVVYETPEGRKIWKLKPLQLLVTLIGVIFAAVIVVVVDCGSPNRPSSETRAIIAGNSASSP